MSKSNKMNNNKVRSFNAQYETLPFTNNINAQNAQIAQIAQIKDEDDFWNSDIFKKQKNVYNNKLEELQDEGKIVSAGPCPFCKSDRTRSEKIQLRRADEGVNIKITCLACGRTKIYQIIPGT